MKFLSLCFSFIVGHSSALSIASDAYNWRPVELALETAIANEAFPGCVAAVTDPTGAVVYMKGFGNFTYGLIPPFNTDNPLMDPVTSLFDMASCSKIIGCTTTGAHLYQLGYLDIYANVSLYLGDAYKSNGKDVIRVMDLLLHQAGYPPDPYPSYDSVTFGCPGSTDYTPPLDFNCSELIFASLLNQTLQYPPTTQWIYSDLSFITMQYVVGSIILSNNLISPSVLLPACSSADTNTPGFLRTCYYEAYLRTVILQQLEMTSTKYLLALDQYQYAVPTWNESSLNVYRHQQVQGVVSDENGYALGGIAGHAGIFSNGLDLISKFMPMWLYGGPTPANPTVPVLLNETTRKLWTTVVNASFSPRALGWQNQGPLDGYNGCGNLANITFYHTGFNGVQFCGDPTRNITTVLLTNRVYPNKTSDEGVKIARQLFNDAVLQVLGLV
jgi:CubicO group peptidase (beta-lactamase class C family)